MNPIPRVGEGTGRVRGSLGRGPHFEFLLKLETDKAKHEILLLASALLPVKLRLDCFPNLYLCVRLFGYVHLCFGVLRHV